MKAVSNWLETWTRFRPDAEALFDVDLGRRWTYAQLYDESLRWAGRLANAGVGAGDRVSLLAYNRGETFALLFAVAELGAILCPMNWRLSGKELLWQLEDAGSKVLVWDGDNAGRVEAPEGVAVLSLEDGPGDVVLDGPGSRLEDPWVMMYTSGTTGKPKGALLTHGQLHWNALNTILACDLALDDSTLTFTPLFHTGGLNCLSTPLLHRGGRVVLTRGFDPEQALQLIEAEGVTLLMGVPTIYQMMADHPRFPETDLSTVRDALCGGAPLSVPLLRRYLAREIPLRQGFGMTEVGPNCFSMPHEAVERKIDSVGKAIPHVAMKLVRQDGTECQIDEPGELLLKGPAVFGGYWQNPAANEKSFVDGWFRTGDILSQDAEGFFRVSGRLKEMFISGGENVYPAEVEAAILEHGHVAQVAVIGIPDERWGEVGAAFIQPEPGQHIDAGALQGYLREHLARFKVPKLFHVFDELPRTASGKIDKQALKASLTLEET
ncbi:MAG: long-chain fatty acid--CoA ligase [Alphaproteobacteria bacterium]|nr:long-chain fatty acid--CoA ligase [Alphaproteobacteria bacterium]